MDGNQNVTAMGQVSGAADGAQATATAPKWQAYLRLIQARNVVIL